MMPVFSALRLISGYEPQGMHSEYACNCVFARNNGVIWSNPAPVI